MHNEATYDVVVVGGGIVGAATFFKLQKRFPELRMLLIDKMEKLADHQTGNNSGVIHSGLYYKPGSLKAVNCVQGRRELVQFCKDHDVPHDVCGKVVVAADESELPMLEKIHGIGKENQIEDMARIDADQLREIEPHCKGVAALWVGCTGIVDFRDATEKMAAAALAIQPMSAVRLGEEVVDLGPEGDGSIIRTLAAGESRTYHADKVVVCAGLQADRLARKDGVL